jgi:hypothetical protein
LTHPNETSKTQPYPPQASSADRQEARRPSTLPAANYLLGIGAAFADKEIPIEADCGSLAQNIDWASDEDDDPLDRFFRSQGEELVPRLMQAAHVYGHENEEVSQVLSKVSHLS